MLAALEAFAFDIALIWRVPKPDARFAPNAAMKRGVPALGGEFGGGGARRSARSLAKVERGLRRELVHMGLMEKPKDWAAAPKPTAHGRAGAATGTSTRRHPACSSRRSSSATRSAPATCAATCISSTIPARPAVPCHFRKDGFVICQRHYGRVERGDCVAHLAIDV